MTLVNNPAPAHPFRISQKYGELRSVIPGRAQREPGIQCETDCVDRWIPGLRLAAHPGMTKHSRHSRLLALPVRQIPHDDIEDRREDQAEQRHAEHAEEHGDADRLTHLRPRA